MNTILIAGFEPWGTHFINSSKEAVLAAKPQTREPWKIKKIILPVDWEKSWALLKEKIDQGTKGIIAFGTSSRKTIQPERIAINLCDPNELDAVGQNSKDLYVESSGPPAYWSTLPVDSLVNDLKQAQLPTEPSPNAGTFLCNYVFYQMAHHLNNDNSQAKSGFIHLPSINPETSTLEDLALAVETSVKCLIEFIEKSRD